ncbi:glycosyltransferase family 2 protein [Microbacterium trichothecenolyticum]|uniref:glycosyltransferase family 2 protein n=1 Tax=Microbacterium trichothecenolyticum TaxID=69370 RepID=UPI0035BE24EC
MSRPPIDAPRLDIIVPVYGGWQLVEQCLQSLEAQTVPVRVTVVDDRSPDDTLRRVRERFGGFQVIANKVNRGFAASCNIGIRAGRAEFVLLLNSDVVAQADLAATILAAFDADDTARAGSVSPILLGPDGTVDSFGVTADDTVAGFVRFHGAQLNRVHNGPALLGPYGAAAAYRRAALNGVGLLDENIFMYGEELDLALRLRAAGWGALEVAKVVGTHIGGASAGRESERQRYLSGFGRGYLLRVYGILRGRHAVRALVTEAAVTALRLLTRRDAASLRGRVDGWRKGRGVPRRPVPGRGIDSSIGFRQSLAMRKAGYWNRR